MNFFKRMTLCALALLLESPASYAWMRIPPRDNAPVVQLAILLDTSNSMDGLIEQAKSQLWKIANDLAYSSRYGQRPILQVALYEYGNNWLSAGENYIRQVLPFTTDMDLVSEKLFSLRTNGGQEYCGAVIKDALNGLQWSTRSDVYKVIFIAGNEPFTQGSVYFRDSIAQAVRKGIVVNPIFCGAYSEGVQTQWYDGAIVGHGSYLNIDQNMSVVVDPTPYDAEIGRLGVRLNETAVPYGADGRRMEAARNKADQLAALKAPAAAPVERALFKGTAQYAMKEADAVSQVASGKMKVTELKKDQLPAALQSKSLFELESYFKDQQKTRDDVQKQLAELKQSREDYLAKKQSEKTSGTSLSLDQAMRKVIREQAGKLHFSFGGVQ